MTEPRTLPHDDYVTLVCDALTTAGIEPTNQTWTSDSENRGNYCYLGAVITLDPDNALDLEIPADVTWPHGLLLTWEWHTGVEVEDGEPPKGPVWEFAELRSGGSNEYPTDLPVRGYADPAAVVEAVRKVVTGEIGAGSHFNYGRAEWAGGIIGGTWERADVLDAACEEWGAKETAGLVSAE